MRASGILLHPTSLPGPYGVGDLGPEAWHFAEWLAGAGQTIWQVLPAGPTGYGESPYALFSSFAGNPLLVSLDRLVENGWLDPVDPPSFPADRVDFETLIPWKNGLLRRAFHRFGGGAEFDAFCHEESAWLEVYARFMALKHAHRGASWTEWASGAAPDPREMDFHRFVQFEFFREWRALKAHAAAHGIRIMGDLPIYVAGDSADVWAHPELFRFDRVAGVPPDYFSATGQLWGNPTYRWDRMESGGYRWWIERMRAALRMFDMVRLDHFRGFEAFWEVPAGAPNAIGGRWVKGPGASLFHALKHELGDLPLVAENLGVITPEVEALRREFGFPGMAILQFAFGRDPQAPDFQPHNYTRDLAAYTGTHDNDTVAGWWRSDGGDSTRTAEEIRAEKERACAYLDLGAREIHWVMIRTLMASVADTVVFPVQDLLGLGSEARMNTPATLSGNWRWRMAPGALTPALARRMSEMVRLYGRLRSTGPAAAAGPENRS